MAKGKNHMRLHFSMVNSTILGRNGAVLLMTLTFLSALFVMILSLNATVGLNLQGNSQYRRQIQGELLANAGLEQAFWQINNQVFSNPQGLVFVNTKQTLDFQEPPGTVIYDIRDEEARFNLYKADKNLLSSTLGLDQAMAERLVSMIKGMSALSILELSTNFFKEIGIPAPRKDKDEENYNIGELFTIWGDGRINVNTASQRVLSLIPGLPPETAGAIVKYREENRAAGAGGINQQVFADSTDLIGKNLLPEKLYNRISSWIKFESSFYSIRSTAYMGRNKEFGWSMTGAGIVQREDSQVRFVSKRINNG